MFRVCRFHRAKYVSYSFFANLLTILDFSVSFAIIISIGILAYDLPLSQSLCSMGNMHLHRRSIELSTTKNFEITNNYPTFDAAKIGEMLEWLKRFAWKADIGQKSIAGSNPALSAESEI